MQLGETTRLLQQNAATHQNMLVTAEARKKYLETAEGNMVAVLGGNVLGGGSA